jgi:hypothetical protein
MRLKPFFVKGGGIMAQRIIRTVDGQCFADHCSYFQDHKDHILYRKGFFNKVRINKRNIITDNINGAVGEMLILGLAALGLLMIGLAVLNN